MKKPIAIFLAFMLFSALLCGCAAKTDDGKSEPDATPGATPNPEPAELKGETYSTGVFSVFVPTGWIAKPQTFNNEPNLENLVLIKAKGAKGVINAVNCPTMQIELHSDRSTLFRPTDKGQYTNVQDLEPFVLENSTWEGFTGERSLGEWAILLDSEEVFQIAVRFKGTLSEQPISLGDADVLAIIASISLDE